MDYFSLIKTFAIALDSYINATPANRPAALFALNAADEAIAKVSK